MSPAFRRMLPALQLLYLHPRRMFLFDFLGALISLFFLLLMIQFLYPWVGLPKQILLLLAGLAALYALTSMLCYALQPAHTARWLTTIALANLAYACLTLFIMGLYRHQVTLWGCMYLISEALVLFLLARLEWKVAAYCRHTTKPPSA